MKRVFILLLVMACSTQTFSQLTLENKMWMFGTGAALDFRSGSPVPVPAADFHFREGCASVSGVLDELLFYTDGSYVWNRNHDTMQNGNNLTGLPPAPAEFGVYSPTYSTAQGAVIVPVPDNLRKYYIFSQTALEGKSRYGGRLYYSMVDMDLAGGLGGVMPAVKGIYVDSGFCEAMTAVAGNHCDIWLLAARRNEILAYNITAAGFDRVPVVSVNSRYSRDVDPILGWDIQTLMGMMKVSPDRRRLALTDGNESVYVNGISLFDFDPGTGTVTNMRRLSTQSYYGLCFSPDNNLLYASTTAGFNVGDVEQFDLTLPTLPAIVNSRTRIGGCYNSELKIGPDGKMYFRNTATRTADGWGIMDAVTLGCIPFPDRRGPACGYVDTAVVLRAGTFMGLGLPHDLPVRIKKDTLLTTKRVQVCFRDKILLTAGDTSGNGYTWNNGARGKDREVSAPGRYWITYETPPCRFHTDTFDVHFSGPLPVTGTSGGCRGGENGLAWVVPAAGDTTLYTYTWYNTDGIMKRTHTGRTGDTLARAASGRYRLSLAASNGCDTILDVVIPVPQYLVGFTTDTIICQSDTAAFRNTSSGDRFRFSWDFGDGAMSVEEHPHHHFKQPGSYRVILAAENSRGCLDTVSVMIAVDSQSGPYFTMDKDMICSGEAIRFYPDRRQGLTTLSWDFGDGSVAAHEEAPVHVYDTTGLMRISLRAEYRACPPAYHTDTVTVYPVPVVDLGIDTAVCPGSDPVSLRNLAIPETPVKYRWNTGASAKSILVNTPGVYSLTILSQAGCTAADSIRVLRSCYVEIPNVFTPNGDGSNDYFFPANLMSRALLRFRMQLFNRWGQVIFETANISDRGWDGTQNGVPQPAGVYAYRIEASFADGSDKSYQGNVTLLR